MFDFKNKDQALKGNIELSLSKTLSMFEWEGLPETIPVKELEKMLQVFGYAFITEVKGELYAFTGGLGGEPDVYGNPTKIVIANPALNYNASLNVNEDGVLIYNDDMQVGLYTILEKYNSLLVENDLSMLINSYASRTQLMISATDDKTRASVDRFLTKLVEGDLAAVGENALFDGIKTHNNTSTNNQIKNLIEFHQYIKASMYNELGLDASFNMKRERLNTAEVGQNDDGLYPFIDNMMKCRLSAVEDLRERYSLESKVGYGSIWGVKNKRLVDGVVEEEQEPEEDPEEQEPEEEPEEQEPEEEPEPEPEPEAEEPEEEPEPEEPEEPEAEEPEEDEEEKK